MPHYQFGDASLSTVDNLTLDEARARLAEFRLEMEAEEASWNDPDLRTEKEREDARLLAEKFAEPIGSDPVGPFPESIVLVKTSWEDGRILESHRIDGWTVFAEPGLSDDAVRELFRADRSRIIREDAARGRWRRAAELDRDA